MRTVRLLLLCLPLVLTAAESTEAAWFETNVRPILHERCFEWLGTRHQGGLDE